MEGVWIALGLTIFAGMATSIGSIISFTAKRTNYRFLSVATGFSAGVMLYVSFVEIFPKGSGSLIIRYGDYWGHWMNAAAFFGGMLLIGLVDATIPSAENPHETHTEEETAPLHDTSALMNCRQQAGPTEKATTAFSALQEG
jgi:ZIP family zinc transporter